MKVLFSTMPSFLDNRVDTISYRTVPTTAMYLLGGILKDAGIDVSFLDPSVILMGIKGNDFENVLMSFCEDKDLILLSSNTINWCSTAKAIKVIKKLYPTKCIAVGGVHPTYFFNYILKNHAVDYVLLGEGESVIIPFVREYLSGIRDINLPGVVSKNSCYSNSKIYPITDNDLYEKLPLPAFEELPEKTYFAIPIETSRGCRFSCGFCSVPYRHNWRNFNVKNVIQRSERIIKKFGEKFIDKQVFVTDDCLTANMKRAISVVEGLFSIDSLYRYMFETRITDWLQSERENAANIFNNAQCARLGFGIECGYDRGLRKISKGLDIATLLKVLGFLEKKNLIEKSYMSFIIGFPWETLDDCLETINFAANIERMYGPGRVNINWLKLYPSRIWDERKKYGIEVDEDIFDDESYLKEGYFSETHPSLNKHEVRFIEGTIKEYEAKGIILRNI